MNSPEEFNDLLVRPEELVGRVEGVTPENIALAQETFQGLMGKNRIVAYGRLATFVRENPDTMNFLAGHIISGSGIHRDGVSKLVAFDDPGGSIMNFAKNLLQELEG